ncbi:MAG: Uma2 family endonuclease [Kastovskya adunca ATA6-11-RM4]|jgi:Uma2 family endonuclease|nr:Uma2 family endonuclease [Kastovskya adunca ATA6-11-RM4]
MSVDATPETIYQTADTPDWVPPPPPSDLIFDDGEPLESNRHRIAMNLLIRSLQQAWAERDDYFAGGNMFVYYSRTQARNRDFKGPDFFVALNVDGTRPRQGWVVWDEDGRYPDAIVELMSPSTASTDTGVKKEIYEGVFRTRDYFVFDPFNPDSLQGWRLDANFRYQPLVPNEQGSLWCETLGFWLGIWEGTIDRETALWLRFFDPEGNLVLLPEEAERQRAEAERQRAEAQQQRAETERQRAEAERQRAEAQQQRAETERQRAEAQQQRAERLAARLRELGENPDNL